MVPNQQGQQGQGSSSASQVANVPGAPNAQAYSVTLRNFLQNRPEVMDQLKLLLIQRMRDDGSLVDDQTVSDQMVYEHMQSDPEFRADAIHSLIDQGYISEDDAKALLGSQNNPAYAQGYQPRENLNPNINSELYPTAPSDNISQGNVSGMGNEETAAGGVSGRTTTGTTGRTTTGTFNFAATTLRRLGAESQDSAPEEPVSGLAVGS